VGKLAVGTEIPNIRIGHGFDVHAFAEGRKLVLGAVEIPCDRGLAGHSDADVLLHAIIDALLGSLSLGDIGTWFPDTVAENKDIESSKMFKKVWEDILSRGWRLVNCDAVVMAQTPKLSPYTAEIRTEIAKLFEVSLEQVSLKATTTERLGFLGREEGIASSAVVLLSKAN